MPYLCLALTVVYRGLSSSLHYYLHPEMSGLCFPIIKVLGFSTSLCKHSVKFTDVKSHTQYELVSLENTVCNVFSVLSSFSSFLSHTLLLSCMMIMNSCFQSTPIIRFATNPIVYVS
jgi:hypothetical protein